MALFKKKNQTEEKKNDAVSEKEFDYKTAVLQALNKKLEKGNLYDGCIIMPRGFTIDVKIGRDEEKEGIKLLQIVYIVSHDDFDEELIDPVDSQGKSWEDAVKMSVDIFYASVWHPLDQSMFKKNPIPLSINYLNQHYDYDMYAQSIVRIGAGDKGQPTALWTIIKNEIPKYLGSKKYYWLRIYLAKHKDREVVEVRMNGSVCTELGKFFKPYMDSIDAGEAFICEKQYAIFVNRGDDECPFKKEVVKEGAKFVLEKLVNVNSKDDYMEMSKELDNLTGNKNVSAEIRIFVPEILAKLTLGYQEGDSLFLLDDDSRIEFKKSQLRSYFYIQQTILEYLGTRPPQEDVQKIVMGSVAYREMRSVLQQANAKAQEDGKSAPQIAPKDLYVPGTAYKISSPDYKPW